MRKIIHIEMDCFYAAIEDLLADAWRRGNLRAFRSAELPACSRVSV